MSIPKVEIAVLKNLLIFGEKYLPQSVRLLEGGGVETLFGRIPFEHASSLCGASLSQWRTQLGHGVLQLVVEYFILDHPPIPCQFHCELAPDMEILIDVAHLEHRQGNENLEVDIEVFCVSWGRYIFLSWVKSELWTRFQENCFISRLCSCDCQWGINEFIQYYNLVKQRTKPNVQWSTPRHPLEWAIPVCETFFL